MPLFLIPLIQKAGPYLLGAIVTMGLIFFIYWAGYTDGKEACQKRSEEVLRKALQEQQDQAIAEQGKLNAATDQLSHALDEERVRSKQIEGKLNAERTKKIYHDCVVPDSGVQLYNSAIK